jgi:histone deacetylase complex regulatory component SIN3
VRQEPNVGLRLHQDEDVRMQRTSPREDWRKVENRAINNNKHLNHIFCSLQSFDKHNLRRWSVRLLSRIQIKSETCVLYYIFCHNLKSHLFRTSFIWLSLPAVDDKLWSG